MNASVQDIVFAFLQTYYQRMSKDPSKVSSLYSLTAELTHINYQVELDIDADVLPTIKVTGKENISKFFTRNNKKVSDLKVLIESCDFQTTGSSHSSILILTTGDMFWTDTPTYRFVQTIILTPNPSNKDSFDVTNDVIRFIPDNLRPCVLETVDPQNEAVDEAQEKKASLQSKDKSNKNGSQENVHVENSKANHNNIERSKPTTEETEQVGDIEKNECGVSATIDSKTLIPDTDEIPRAVPEQTDDKLSGEAPDSKKEHTSNQVIKPSESNEKDEAENQEERKNTKLPENHQKDGSLVTPKIPIKVSWASKLAANVETQKGNTQSVLVSDVCKSESHPPNSKKTSEGKSEDLPSRRENSSNRTLKRKAPLFSTVNRDGYYPIYIKRTGGLTEEILKNALESEFGTVMKMTLSDSFAVVDFETQKSQMDALERKQLIIGDNEIFFSRKTVRKPASSPPIGTSTSLRSHRKHISNSNNNNNNSNSNNNNSNSGKKKDY